MHSFVSCVCSFVSCNRIMKKETHQQHKTLSNKQKKKRVQSRVHTIPGAALKKKGIYLRIIHKKKKKDSRSLFLRFLQQFRKEWRFQHSLVKIAKVFALRDVRHPVDCVQTPHGAPQHVDRSLRLRLLCTIVIFDCDLSSWI